jgi:hypothetical protein
LLITQRTPAPAHTWSDSANFPDHELWLTFYDVAGDPVECIRSVRISELDGFVTTWRCSSVCVGRWCVLHSFTTLRAPDQPTLLDLLGWRA